MKFNKSLFMTILTIATINVTAKGLISSDPGLGHNSAAQSPTMSFMPQLAIIADYNPKTGVASLQLVSDSQTVTTVTLDDVRVVNNSKKLNNKTLNPTEGMVSVGSYGSGLGGVNKLYIKPMSSKIVSLATHNRNQKAQRHNQEQAVSKDELEQRLIATNASAAEKAVILQKIKDLFNLPGIVISPINNPQHSALPETAIVYDSKTNAPFATLNDNLITTIATHNYNGKQVQTKYNITSHMTISETSEITPPSKAIGYIKGSDGDKIYIMGRELMYSPNRV